MTTAPQQFSMFESNPTPEKAAETRRDKGIKRGLTHAEQEKLGWTLLALQSLGHFLGERGDIPFLAEIFRVYAKQNHVPDPPDARAWGGVMRRAQKEGLISSCGAERALTSNCSFKVLWKKR